MAVRETAQQGIANARRLERFHLGRVAFWWALNVPAVVIIFAVDKPLWNRISVLYLVLVSLYANGATDLSNWQAARAERRSIENPPSE